MLDLSVNFRIAGNTARIVTCDVFCSQGTGFRLARRVRP
jgi:hypothetical protein